MADLFPNNLTKYKVDLERGNLLLAIIFLRYFEMDGELQKAIGVLKKRLSDFENRSVGSVLPKMVFR